MRLRTFTLLTLFLLLSGVTFYWLTHEKEPIFIGFVAGLSGKFSDLGIDCRRGTMMAVTVVNGQGGVKGRQVQLLIKDDKQDTQVARQAVTSLLEEDVPAIIGHATSSMTMSTLPLVNDSTTLLVAPTTSTAELKDIDDNFFRSCAVSTDAATLMAEYLFTEKNILSAGIIYDLSNNAYTVPWYETFKASFLEAGGERVEPITFTSSSNVQLLPIIMQMKELDVDALVIVASSVDAAMLCQQARKIGWQVPLALADWAATEQLINLGGQAVEGAIFHQFFNRENQKPEYLQFKKDFEQMYKEEPGFGAMHAYNATMMVLRSLGEQQDNETLKQTILRISIFDGLQHEVVINNYGDSNHPTYMGQVRSGKFVIFEDRK